MRLSNNKNLLQNYNIMLTKIKETNGIKDWLYNNLLLKRFLFEKKHNKQTCKREMLYS